MTNPKALEDKIKQTLERLHPAFKVLPVAVRENIDLVLERPTRSLDEMCAEYSNQVHGYKNKNRFAP